MVQASSELANLIHSGVVNTRRKLTAGNVVGKSRYAMQTAMSSLRYKTR